MGLKTFFDKPEYLFRPSQLLRRLCIVARPEHGQTVARLPWGKTLLVDADEMIGSAIVRLGVYDLVVTEALWRLVDPGDVALDVGANIGVMTSVLEERVGAEGAIHAFEPHPRLCGVLRQNVARWGARNVNVYEVAVGDTSGEVSLFIPTDFRSNSGIASVRDKGKEIRSIPVQAATLDELLPTIIIPTVVKLDVEGAEEAVLWGGTCALRSVRDLIFEHHLDYPSEITVELEARGFAIRRLERSLTRPLLSDPTDGQSPRFDAQSLLATRDLGRAERRMTGRGWNCLRG